jgi:osmotically inducible protein OsmC
MKLSFNLTEAGFVPDNLETTCTTTFENGVISNSHLDLKATVKGIDKAKFDEPVKDAELNCPISKSLNTSITVSSKLI